MALVKKNPVELGWEEIPEQLPTIAEIKVAAVLDDRELNEEEATVVWERDMNRPFLHSKLG